MSTKAPHARSFYGISFNPDERVSHEFGPEELEDELRSDGAFSWIDVQSPNIDDLNEVLSALDIDLHLISHFGTPEVLPRIVERPDCLAFYLYEIFSPESHLDTTNKIREIQFARVLLVIGRDFVITYHRGPIEAVEYVRDSCVDAFALAGRTPAFIAFLFLQRCLYDYAHLNLANDNFLDALGDSVGVVDPDELREVISIAGANILTLKKLVASLHIVLMLLATKRSPFVSAAAQESFLQMLQNVHATREAVDSSRDMLDGIVSGMQAIAAGRTEDIARVLTVVSAIFLPLGLIAGIYGMNFDHMPELHWHHAYFGMLGIMAAVAVALLVLFWRMGWFSNQQR
jgi:magnesium transporter